MLRMWGQSSCNRSPGFPFCGAIVGLRDGGRKRKGGTGAESW